MSAIGSLSVRITPDATGFQSSVNNTMRSMSSSMSAKMAATGAVASTAFTRAFRRSGDPAMRAVSGGLGRSLSKGINGGVKEGVRSIKGNVLQLVAGQLSGVFAKAGTKATLGLTVPLGGVGLAAIKTAADFDSAMSQLAAALDKPLESMGSLEQLADQVGKDTVYSAKDAADAMVALAKSGFSEADIQAGALTSTMSLAAAGGIELASAADLIGSGMHTFNLEASQSGRIADALAGAASSSAADVADLSDALVMVGQSAAMSGQSIEMTTAALAAMADNGVRGSDAGTSLKTMLMRLASPTGKAADEMERYNLSFYDAQGNMKGLDQIAGELQTGLSGLTQEQRAQALQTIFGADAIRAANILYGEGEQGIKKYLKATSTAGNAEERAAKQLGPLAKALESLKGSLETASKELGQALAPAIQAAANALGWLVDKFTALPDWAKSMVAYVGLALASIGPILLGIAAALQAIVVGSTLWGFAQLALTLRRNLPAVVKGVKEWAGAQRGLAAATAATEAAQSGVFIGGAGKKAEEAGEQAAKSAKRWSILNAASNLIGTRFKFVGKMTDSLGSKFPRMFGWLSKGSKGMEAVGQAAKVSGGRLLGFTRLIPGIGWAIGLVVTALVALKQGWDKAWEDVSWFAGSMTGIWNDIKAEVTKTVNAIKDALGPAFAQVKEAISGFTDAAEASGALDILAQAFRALGQVIKFVVMVGGGYLRVFFGAIADFISTIAEGMQRASAIVSSAMLQMMKGIQTALRVLGNVPGFGWAKKAADSMGPVITNLERIHAYNNVPVKVRVESKEMLSETNRIANDLKEKVPPEVRTKADIDIAAIRAGVPEAVANLRKLPKKYKTELGLDDKGALKELEAYARQFDDLPETVKAKIRLDAKDAKADAKQTKDDIEDIPNKKKSTISANVKNGQDVADLQKDINSLTGKKVKIRADASSVKTEAASAEKAVSGVEQKSPIEIRADASQALNEIARVKTALDNLQSIQRSITYTYRTVGTPPSRGASAPSSPTPGARTASAASTFGARASAASGILSGGFTKSVSRIRKEIADIGKATRDELRKQADITGKTEAQIAADRMAFQRAQRQQEEAQQRKFDDAAADRDRARSIAQETADKKKLKGGARKKFVASQIKDEQKVADRERKRLRALQDRAEVETAIYDQQQQAQQQAADQINQAADLRESAFTRGTSADALESMLADLQKQKARGQIAKGAVAAVNQLINDIGTQLAARKAVEQKWAAFDLSQSFADAMKGDADGMQSAIDNLQRSIDLGEIAVELVGQAQQQIAALQQQLAQRRADEARWASEDLLEGTADAFKEDASMSTITDKIKELTRQLDRGELPESVRGQAKETLAALKNLVPPGTVAEVYDRLNEAFKPLSDFGDTTNPAKLAAQLRKNTALMQGYSANMEKLKSSGASKALIDKIQAMDPAAGAKLMERLVAGGASAINNLDSALAGMTAAAEGASTALSQESFTASSVKAGTLGGMATTGAPIQMDVHPSAGMDERDLALMASKEMAWMLSSAR